RRSPTRSSASSACNCGRGCPDRRRQPQRDHRHRNFANEGAPMSVSTPVDTTYKRFAQDPAYTQANAAYVEHLPLAKVTRILDLCGGTGAVGQLLLAGAPNAS